MKLTNGQEKNLSAQFVECIDLTDANLEEINIPELGHIQGGFGSCSCGSCFVLLIPAFGSCGSCSCSCSCGGFGFGGSCSCESCGGFDSFFGGSCGSCESCGSCGGVNFNVF